MNRETCIEMNSWLEVMAEIYPEAAYFFMSVWSEGWRKFLIELALGGWSEDVFLNSYIVGSYHLIKMPYLQDKNNASHNAYGRIIIQSRICSKIKLNLNVAVNAWLRNPIIIIVDDKTSESQLRLFGHMQRRRVPM